METANNQNITPEVWQVEVNGQVYETNFEEMTQWIAEGALLPADKVRRGNLRWLDANKVPLLYGFFNAKELGLELPKVSTTINQPIQPDSPAAENFSTTENFAQSSVNAPNTTANFTYQAPQRQPNPHISELPVEPTCVVHPGEEPKFSCQTCLSVFCKNCPNSYGSVKICPMCGAMCEPFAEVRQKQEKQTKFEHAANEGFGFSDFGRALAFPFKYKVSLIGGAIMYMLFTLGQSATAVGGIYMIVSAIFCAMLANMLTFGILANTVDNFSQGKINTNFMPEFDDFSLWDDVIHPFILSIGVYISSFGPMAAIIFVMMFFFLSGTKPQMDSLKQKTVEGAAPELRNEYESTSQVPQIKSITDNIKDKNAQHNKQIDAVENNGALPVHKELADDEKSILALNEEINQTRKKQLESTIGKTTATEQAETAQLMQKLMSVALPFILLTGAAFLWGLFYFPAACAVAGYTRSFGSTVNPLVGLDTIRHLGIDYVKILGMCLLLTLVSLVTSGILKVVLAPLDLPRFGNIPANLIGSLFTFYFSIVFSLILGYALHKNSAKLKLAK